MLIRQSQLRGIASGNITHAFRRWRSPSVKTGGTLRTALGVLAIDEVRAIREDEITEGMAAAAGYQSREELIAELSRQRDGTTYSIRLRLSGPDPRTALRERADISAAELAQIRDALDRLDRRAPAGPWTHATLAAIEATPGRRAADVAASLGVEKAVFKPQVRKLKELGLTESLEVGYRLSPRGKAFIASATASSDSGGPE